MMIVDELAGEIGDLSGRRSAVEKLGHPLLEHRRLSHLPPAGDGVDPRSLPRQRVEESEPVNQRLLGEEA